MPLQKPVASKGILRLDVYDPTMFVSFAFAEGDDTVTLAGAPAGCSVAIERPKPLQPGQPLTLSESFFNSLTAVERFRRAVRQPRDGDMPVSRLAVRASVVLAAVALLAMPALAQGGPFGVGPKPPLPDGVLGWILSVQAEFYRGLTQALRAARTDPAAAGGLVALSLAYGVFHAAGPGHGKAVISAYLLANEATWRRGTALAFAAAMVQALVAVALVGAAATVVRMTAVEMGATVRAIETTAYAGVLGLGLWLTWTKGRALWTAWRGDAAAGCAPGCDHAAPSRPGRSRRTRRPEARRPGGAVGGPAAMLGRAGGAGVRAGQWRAVARRGGDLRHGARHGDDGGGHRGAGGVRQAGRRCGSRWPPAAAASCCCAALELVAALAVAAFGAALLAGYMVAERVMPF